ncbi:YopX family protein [Clostridium perfringens]|uniref:YopX family protein n=1 Tax=Clostridium perfringens TaxID=1502 RepID=UPI0024BC0039|nr:YopX family protein [Clostridium perfringens]
MNRIIKFKGKSLKHNIWMCGHYCELNNRGYIILGNDLSMAEEVDINTVGLYTGMKDVKGQEIYENDILKFTQLYNISYDTSDDIETKEFYTDVKWEEGCFWIKDDGDDDYLDFLGAFIGDVYPLTDIEVVGNIYDNPELLK